MGQAPTSPNQSNRLLDLLQLLPVPDELASEEQYDRAYHLDLPDLSRIDVERELVACRLINLVVDSPWHLEREALLVERLAP